MPCLGMSRDLLPGCRTPPESESGSVTPCCQATIIAESKLVALRITREKFEVLGSACLVPVAGLQRRVLFRSSA